MRRSTLTLAVTVLLAACSDPDPTAPLAPDALRAAAALDSTAALVPPASVGTLAQLVPITLREGDGFRIRFESRECAAQGNVFAISHPVPRVLTVNGCATPGLGTTWTFDGPYAEGTEVTFRFHSGFRNQPGQLRITGSYPSWRIECEDGFDSDFNDLVFSLTAFCTLFAGAVNDALLGRSDVQDALRHLWDESRYHEPDIANRRERGGYLVERGGVVELVEYNYRSEPNPCQIRRGRFVQETLIRLRGGTIVGEVHTHPLEVGVVYDNPGNCPQVEGARFMVVDGPSDADERRFRRNEADWPSIIMEPHEVHRLDQLPGGRYDEETVPRNTNCL